MTVYDVFFGTGFKTLCFHPSILETERFQRDSFQMAPLLKPSFISVLGGVHDGQREKKVRVFTRKRVSLVGASEFLGRLRQSQCCFASFNHAEHPNGFASFSFSSKTQATRTCQIYPREDWLPYLKITGDG